MIFIWFMVLDDNLEYSWCPGVNQTQGALDLSHGKCGKPVWQVIIHGGVSILSDHQTWLAGKSTIYQWPFQDPKLEVPTIYKAYVLGLCKGISPQNMAKHMVLTYLHFRILEFPLNLVRWFPTNTSIYMGFSIAGVWQKWHIAWWGEVGDLISGNWWFHPSIIPWQYEISWIEQPY